MGLITGASMKDVSTEFVLVEPGTHEFEFKKYTEVENNGKFENLDREDLIALRFTCEVIGSSVSEENVGRFLSEYINLRDKKGELTQGGLASVKRYFEACFGKDTVAEWDDDDFDYDRLVGRRFAGQVKIDSYTKQGETEPRKNNSLVAGEPI